MPQLLKDAQRDIDFKIADVDEGEDGNDTGDKKTEALHIKLKGMEGTK